MVVVWINQWFVTGANVVALTAPVPKTPARDGAETLGRPVTCMRCMLETFLAVFNAHMSPLRLFLFWCTANSTYNMASEALIESRWLFIQKVCVLSGGLTTRMLSETGHLL